MSHPSYWNDVASCVATLAVFGIPLAVASSWPRIERFARKHVR